MNFRKGVPDDLPELYDIATEAAQALPYGVAVDQESVEKYVDPYMGPEKSVFVLEDEGIQACFGISLDRYWFNGHETFARIDFLFVRPGARKAGLSSTLLKTLRWLTENYNTEFGFDSGGRMEAKHRFFRRFGFERIGYNYLAKKVT